MDIQNKTQIKAALRQSFGAVVYSINELNEEQFFEPRAEGKWSPADILGHLILSTKPVTKAMSTPKLMLKAAFGKSNREEKTLTQLYDKYIEALSKGQKAPPNFTYNGAKEKGREKLLGDFTDQLDKLLLQIDKWEEKDLSSYILPHPAIGKITIREMLYFTHFHTEHHHEQVLEVGV